MKKTAEQFLKEKGKKRDFDPNGYCEFDSLVKLLEQYADQFKPKWISVDDRLPNDKQHFDGYHPELGRITNLVFREGQFIQDADCKANAPCWRNMQTLWIDITHWMPLPEKP